MDTVFAPRVFLAEVFESNFVIEDIADMASRAQTAAGTRIFIADGLPATFDETGYEALSYVEVGEVTEITTYGKTYNIIEHQPLADRKTYKHKGSYNEGQISINYAVALGPDGEPGQELLFEWLEKDGATAFKIQLTDDPDDGINSAPTRRYFPAKVASAEEEIGSVDSIVTGTTNLEIDGDILRLRAQKHA